MQSLLCELSSSWSRTHRSEITWSLSVLQRPDARGSCRRWFRRTTRTSTGASCARTSSASPSTSRTSTCARGRTCQASSSSTTSTQFRCDPGALRAPVAGRCAAQLRATERWLRLVESAGEVHGDEVDVPPLPDERVRHRGRGFHSLGARRRLPLLCALA